MILRFNVHYDMQADELQGKNVLVSVSGQFDQCTELKDGLHKSVPAAIVAAPAGS